MGEFNTAFEKRGLFFSGSMNRGIAVGMSVEPVQERRVFLHVDEAEAVMQFYTSSGQIAPLNAATCCVPCNRITIILYWFKILVMTDTAVPDYRCNYGPNVSSRLATIYEIQKSAALFWVIC